MTNRNGHSARKGSSRNRTASSQPGPTDRERPTGNRNDAPASGPADTPIDRVQPWQLLGLKAHEEEFCRLKLANPTLSGVGLVRLIEAYQGKSKSSQSNIAHNLNRNPAVQQRIRQ